MKRIEPDALEYYVSKPAPLIFEIITWSGSRFLAKNLEAEFQQFTN
jgi:hypothetical protein